MDWPTHQIDASPCRALLSKDLGGGGGSRVEQKGAYGVVRGKGKGKERMTVKVDATRLGCVYTSAPPLCHRFGRLGDVGQGPMV